MRKLAVLGPKGTYSDVACSKLSEDYLIEYDSNIYAVLEHVNETTDALIPFENTLDGFVMESLDGIMKYNYKIQRQLKLEVQFQFVSFEESLEDIHSVYVQFKAYGQCLDYILSHHLKPIITQSNMESLNLLKDKREAGYGAIIPAHTKAKEFSFVEKSIIKNSHNETRFVLISKELKEPRYLKHFNSSLEIIPALDAPGILYSILRVFGEYKMNLKSILSRPRRDLIGNYVFYIEIEGTQEEIKYLEYIKKSIEDLNCTFKILGIYNAL